MEQYFNFTPYVTDTPVSFTITDGSFMDFIIKNAIEEDLAWD